MNLPKTLATGLFATTLVFTLAACSSAEPAQTNNIVPEKSSSAAPATPAVSEADNQQAVAARYQEFLDGVYSFTEEDVTAFSAIYGSYDTSVEPTEEQKKEILDKAEGIFPEFTIINTADVTIDEKSAIYGVILTTGMLAAQSGTSATVPAEAVMITGDTAAISTEALVVTVDGEVIPTSPSSAEPDVTFTLIDGEWLIDPDIYLAMMNN